MVCSCGPANEFPSASTTRSWTFNTWLVAIGYLCHTHHNSFSSHCHNQYHANKMLPQTSSEINTSEWCPIWLHSLDPYDNVLRKIFPSKVCQDSINIQIGDSGERKKETTGSIEKDIPMTVCNGHLVEKTVDNEISPL